LHANAPSRRPVLAATVVIGLIYVVTLFPGVGGRINHGDSAKFDFIGVVAGVSHPPGNPLYILVNAVAVRLFWFAPPYFVVNALSLACGTLAVYLTGSAAQTLTQSRLAGVASASALALGPTFWTLSTEAEVYTLAAAFLAGATYCMARYVRYADVVALRWGVAAFLLGFANHLTAIAFAPAFALLVGHLARVDKRAALRILPIVGVAAILVIACYAYVPIRAAQGTPYSELHDGVTVRSVLEYVTARQYQGNLAVPTPGVLMDRLPETMRMLQKQWTWPALLGAVGGGFWVAHSSRLAGSFFGTALAAGLLLALVYHIDDPDGFYVPLFVFISILMGASVMLARSRGARAAIAGALILAFVPRVRAQLVQVRAQRPQDLVEGVDDLGEVAWDIPSLIAEVPPGSDVLAPCGHYGCAEVLNYYRFADREFARKDLAIAHLPGRPEGWHAPWRPVAPSRTSQRPICGILPSDRVVLQASGLRVRTILRDPVYWRGSRLARPAIYCTEVR
jgi:hypothetical protein